jgi:Fe-Mn family superoxide dismutase
MFRLPELTYGYDSLQPTVSETTMRTHHEKHHKAYIDTTNILVADKDLGGRTLEAVVRHAKDAGEQRLFNQSGQAWNHAFFWACMTPDRGGRPGGALASAINAAFGSFEELRSAFVAEGAGHFGSGWVWLMAEGETLKVISTHDADTAIVHPGAPLLVCDLWEHAYYLDYKNARKDFLEAWFDNIANWPFAERQFEAARDGGAGYRFPAPTARTVAGAGK